MNKALSIILLSFISVFSLTEFVFAQGMMGNMMGRNNASLQAQDDEHTAREEAEGKEIWEKLEGKELQCKDLSDENFGALGEYFMGQMMGESHASMNTMMMQMHGEEGEEQIHVVMGKRMSGCDTNAALSPQMGSWMPMMQMMSSLGYNQLNPAGSRDRGTYGGGNPMMWGFGNNPMGWGLGGFGWIFMILWWVLIIIGIIALIKWLTSQSRTTHDHEKSPFEILKERYARGEIDKKEFEEKKKDLI